VATKRRTIMPTTMKETHEMLRAFFNPRIRNAPEYIKDEIMQYSSIKKHLTESEYLDYLEFGPRIKSVRRVS
jgi:hypothetical protein